MTEASAQGRTTIVVTQRERFGMTEESLSDLIAKTPDARIVYVDAYAPKAQAAYLDEMARKGAIHLIRRDRFLTPNQARNLGAAAAETDFIAFVDNDMLFTDGWLERLVECADETGGDVIAPLTCQGLPAHTEVHHAGGDYAPGGDMAGFFAADPETGRAFEEVMHGHGCKLSELDRPLERGQTGMAEFHCVLVRRSTFEALGGLDEKLLSSKEHIDFAMCVRQAGGTVWLEPSSVVTYVFPCRERPMTPEDWPFFALRWSNAYGMRSLHHFIDKWGLRTDPNYVASKRGVYSVRRLQGLLVPLYRRVPLVRRSSRLPRILARASMFPERLLNRAYVAFHDLRAGRA